jgi:protein required for attachment to host cells
MSEQPPQQGVTSPAPKKVDAATAKMIAKAKRKVAVRKFDANGKEQTKQKPAVEEEAREARHSRRRSERQGRGHSQAREQAEWREPGGVE